MTNLKIFLLSDSAQAKNLFYQQSSMQLVNQMEDADYVLQDAGTYRATQPATGDFAPGTLTRRELEVLRLTAEGYSVREVASKLYLSAKTVDAHKVNLMRKLKIHNKAHLVQYAFRNRILSLEDNSPRPGSGSSPASSPVAAAC